MKKAKIISLILVIFMALPMLAPIASFAEELPTVMIECEDSPYTATLSSGAQWAPKEAASTLTKTDGSSTTGLIFTNGEIGAEIEYKVEIPKEGEYTFGFGFRPNWNYYAFVQIKIDGSALGDVINMRNTVVINGETSYDNKVRNADVASIELAKGEHTVTFEVVEGGTAPKNITVVLDYLRFFDASSEETPDIPDTPDTPESADPLMFEGESTPFVTTDKNGVEASVSGGNTWVWNLEMKAAQASGTVAYFRSGGLESSGANVEYTINVKEAGEYSLEWAFRPSGSSYSVVQVYVNGEKTGGLISQNAIHMVAGVFNTVDVCRSVILGNAQLSEGPNKIKFVMVSADGAANQAFTNDYIKLGEPVDESTLTFTDFEAKRPEPNSKENSTPTKVEIPEGMLDKYEGQLLTPATTDKITVYPLAECYKQSSLFTLKVDGVSVPVTSVGGDYEYANFDYDPAKGEIVVEVTYQELIESCVASPQHILQQCKLEKRTATTAVKENGIYNFCINGKNLVVGADPMQSNVPNDEGEGIFNVTKAPYSVTKEMTDKERTAAFQKALDDASAYGSIKGNKNGVVYVPAGVYYIGNLRLGSNTYLYLAPSSVLRMTEDATIVSVDGCKTSLSNPDGTKGLNYTWWISTKFTEEGDNVEGSYDIRIGGRGVVDARGKEFWRSASLGSNTVIPIAASNFTCTGITIREAGCWSVVAVRSNDVELSWLKIYQRMNMGEDDALDICECQNVIVTHCSGYSLDDSFSAKTWPKKVGITMNWPGEPEYNDNILFEYNLAYTRCFGYKIGQGTDQCHYDVAFKNNTVVMADVGIGIHCQSGAGTVYDPVFENCYIEKYVYNKAVRYFGWLSLYTEHNGRGDGNVKNVVVKNIYVYKGAEGDQTTRIEGYNSKSGIEGITLSNIYFDGVKANTLDDIKPAIKNNAYATGLVMKNTDDQMSPLPGVYGEESKPSGPEKPGDEDGKPTQPTEPEADEKPNDEKSHKLTLTLIVGICAIVIIVAAVVVFVILKKKKA